ncbi:hypothetical protein C1I99_12260 [Micromonospora deserti]|uniref:Bacterial Ig-like domain-containing protein n=1 Tax=Micromonospora deserti TaxID=2070366 RepID=A0A2W2E259_9ACTN|nr:hypothetical protein C1I99_12260 [Micromonospora deserti]
MADDRTPVSALRVSFRYTVEERATEVTMSPAGGGLFRGVLADLPRPAETTRIPVHVVAADEAGNLSPESAPVYVTLYPFCTPG